MLISEANPENFAKSYWFSATGNSIYPVHHENSFANEIGLLVLTALFVFGGAMIHGFAFALIVGVLIGTYSSIFVASTATLSLGVTRDDLMPVEKEGSNLDHIP